MAIDPLDTEVTMAAEKADRGGYSLSSGATFGQYKIIRPLGRGGMGEVYEVEHTTLERRYALKLLPVDFAEQTGALERFRREAKVMANLEHPNILKVDEFGEVNGRYWLRMELAQGTVVSGQRSEVGEQRSCVSLEDLAKAHGGKLPQDVVLSVIRQVLEGLQYAHEHGAVHRDLKPSNILFCGETAKIADFGLVRLIGEDWVRSQAQLSVQRSLSMGDMQTIACNSGSSKGTSTRAMLGTFEYMSPEQKRGEDADTRSDLYALGMMTYRILTGRSNVLKLPSRIDAELVRGWDIFIESALEEDSYKRLPDASAALRMLSDVGMQLLGDSNDRLNQPTVEISKSGRNDSAPQRIDRLHEAGSSQEKYNKERPALSDARMEIGLAGLQNPFARFIGYVKKVRIAKKNKKALSKPKARRGRFTKPRRRIASTALFCAVKFWWLFVLNILAIVFAILVSVVFFWLIGIFTTPSSDPERYTPIGVMVLFGVLAIYIYKAWFLKILFTRFCDPEKGHLFLRSLLAFVLIALFWSVIVFGLWFAAEAIDTAIENRVPAISREDRVDDLQSLQSRFRDDPDRVERTARESGLVGRDETVFEIIREPQ